MQISMATDHPFVCLLPPFFLFISFAAPLLTFRSFVVYECCHPCFSLFFSKIYTELWELFVCKLHQSISFAETSEMLKWNYLQIICKGKFYWIIIPNTYKHFEKADCWKKEDVRMYFIVIRNFSWLTINCWKNHLIIRMLMSSSFCLKVYISEMLEIVNDILDA